MSLVKGKFSPGLWYQYFYVPPKSPDMSAYYSEVELQISRAYSFLEKEQVRGKILDFLGVPNTGGKIYKTKLHKIFQLEASAKGKKKLKKLSNHPLKEVTLYPPKSTRPYEGPFKFFKSKNLRKSSQDLKASAPSSLKSDKKTSSEDGWVGLPSHDEESSSYEESIIEVPARSTVRGLSPKRELKTPRTNTKNKVQTKIFRHRPRGTSPLWFETIRSPESSRSYSVESDGDPEFEANSEFKNTNKLSKGAKPVDVTGLNGSPLPRREDASKKTTKPKDVNILSTVDSVNDEIFKKPAVGLLPTIHHSNENPSQISETLAPEESVSDVASKFKFLAGDRTPQLASSTMPSHDSNVHDNLFDKTNKPRKNVEFRNVEYYYYDKPESSGSWTQRSSSGAWSVENRNNDCQNDSSDDNEFDTGFVSPMVMSQESQLMSQDELNNAWWGSSSDHEDHEVCPKEQPLSPEVIVQERSPKQVLLENTKFVEQPPEPSEQLALPVIEQKLFSPVLPKELSSPSQIGIYNPDLELVRRFASMKPSDDERLSQMSAATEVFGANVLVDLRNPKAIAAVEQHCRSILEAVKSQNIPKSSSSMDTAQTFGLFKQQVGRSQQILPVEYISTPERKEQPVDAQEEPFKGEHHQVGTSYITRPQSFSLLTNQNSLQAETSQRLSPIAKGSDVDPMSEISQTSNALSLTSLRQKGKLPFKKRLPVLSAPKKQSSTFFAHDPDPAPIHSAPKKSYSHNDESSSTGKPSRWTNVSTDPLASACMTSVEDRAMGVTNSSRWTTESAMVGESVEPVPLSRSPVANHEPFSSTKSVSSTKIDPPSITSAKTTSLIDLVAVAVKSATAAGNRIESECFLAADKHTSSSTLISGRGKINKMVSGPGNTKCASTSSKGSLKQWQQQANLAWKMSLPHISQQFFNNPGTGDAGSFIDDFASRSGVTLSEISSRVKVLRGEEPREKLQKDSDDLKIRYILTDENSERNALELSGSPSSKSDHGENPLSGDLLFNDNAYEPLSVDLDADTQSKRRNQSICTRTPKKDYSRELESLLSLSMASRSTKGKAPEDSCRDSIPVDHPGPPFPVWWKRDYSTPKHSSIEEGTVSDDSMRVILPVSQLQRDKAFTALAPVDKRRSLKSAQSANRTSAVQTHVITKPSCTNDQSTEHDFFIAMAHELRPHQGNSSTNQ